MVGTFLGDDEAKAAQSVGEAVKETARLGQELVASGSGILAYIDKTIGTLPQDLVAIAGGDWVHEVAVRNRDRLKRNTARKLAAVGETTLTDPSPSVILPLIEAAQMESREELQDLWASLLANAMRENGGRRVRRAYFDTLRQMEPTDALLFGAIARFKAQGQLLTEDDVEMASLPFQMSATELEVTKQSLSRLGIFILLAHINKWRITAYGWQFLGACTVAKEQ